MSLSGFIFGYYGSQNELPCGPLEFFFFLKDIKESTLFLYEMFEGQLCCSGLSHCLEMLTAHFGVPGSSPSHSTLLVRLPADVP